MKFIKMPSWKAWVQRHSHLIKGEGGEAQALKVRLQNCLMKVENVSKEQISLIDLNCYKIKVNIVC